MVTIGFLETVGITAEIDDGRQQQREADPQSPQGSSAEPQTDGGDEHGAAQVERGEACLPLRSRPNEGVQWRTALVGPQPQADQADRRAGGNVDEVMLIGGEHRNADQQRPAVDQDAYEAFCALGEAYPDDDEQADVQRGRLVVGLVDLWAALIAASVLTTYQHHFIDLPTGALVGLLCLWLWPDDGPAPLAAARLAPSPQRRRLALVYGLAGLGLTALGIGLGGAGLWLCWPGLAMALVALNYAFIGAEGFQKRAGRHSLASTALLLPYTLAARANAWLWTRRRPQPDEVADGVWLGRLPDAASMRAGGFRGLVDLTAELPAPLGPWAHAGLPWLDLVAPTPSQLEAAARHIARLQPGGPVLVACALGYSRSASAVAAWLITTRRAASVDEAVAILQRARPRVVLGPAHRKALASLSPAVEISGGA